MSPVGHVAGDAVAGVVGFQAQLLRAGQVHVDGRWRIGRPQDAAVEPPLTIHEDAEADAADRAAATGLETYLGVEGGVLAIEQQGD